MLNRMVLFSEGVIGQKTHEPHQKLIIFEKKQFGDNWNSILMNINVNTSSFSIIFIDKRLGLDRVFQSYCIFTILHFIA